MNNVATNIEEARGLLQILATPNTSQKIAISRRQKDSNKAYLWEWPENSPVNETWWKIGNHETWLRIIVGNTKRNPDSFEVPSRESTFQLKKLQNILAIKNRTQTLLGNLQKHLHVIQVKEKSAKNQQLVLFWPVISFEIINKTIANKAQKSTEN